MSQLLRKCALLTACAALALCFATRSAHAQPITVDENANTATYNLNYSFAPANYAFEHLLFSYWSTANSTDTHVNIHSPFGVKDSDETKNVVHVRVRSSDADFDTNTVVSFNICLMPGDSWTAVLSSDGLRVVDPGECDDDVYQDPDTRTVTHVTTPSAGEMVALGDATEGFIEAWLAPVGGLVDDAVPCALTPATDDAADAITCPSPGVLGGPDPDVMPDTSLEHWFITGTATLVSAMSGFSSSYDALPLQNCDIRGSLDTDDTTGDGCWTINTTAGNAAGEENIINGVRSALMNLGQGTLIGRWTAIADENVMSHTKVVLTFAGGNHLLYKGFDKSNPDYRAEVEGIDPLSLYVFDDAGAIAFRSHELELDQAVNVCRFMQPMEDSMMNGDMDMAGDMSPATSSMLYCNGMEVGEIDAVSGGFRIFNNTMDTVDARDPAGTAPEVEDSRLISNDGAENEGIGTMDDAATPDVDENAQQYAEPIGAIGLVFSYFEGTDGNRYDQVTPVWRHFTFPPTPTN